MAKKCWSTLLICTMLSMFDYTVGGAGRAFPINAELNTIELLRKINPKIEWDSTNLLTDLAGNEVDCSITDTQIKQTDKLTLSGEGIIAIIDYGEGTASDVNSVVEYIDNLLSSWPEKSDIANQIKQSHKVGCSVRPGCKGFLSVACLFSQSPQNIEAPKFSATTTVKTNEEQDELQQDEPQLDEPQNDEYQDDAEGDIRALAFTEQQYDVAEQIIGTKWDRSHYLENLSGFDTNCAMIEANDWIFGRLASPDMRLFGQFGWAENKGDTESALVEILSKFKHHSNIIDVGCSLIPDCLFNKRMYVVASCLYQE